MNGNIENKMKTTEQREIRWREFKVNLQYVLQEIYIAKIKHEG